MFDFTSFIVGTMLGVSVTMFVVGLLIFQNEQRRKNQEAGETQHFHDIEAVINGHTNY